MVSGHPRDAPLLEQRAGRLAHLLLDAVAERRTDRLVQQLDSPVGALDFADSLLTLVEQTS